MKLFFNASVTGRKDYEENYRAIDSILSGLEKHKLIASPTFTAHADDVASETISKAEEYFNKLNKWLKAADINIFEVSYPSLGIGQEVAISLSIGKPTIALHVKGRKPYVMEGMEKRDDKFQLIEYDLTNIKQQLLIALEYAMGMQDTRFNFFISPRIAGYLDHVAKDKRLPRAVYLRKLIEEHMENNKEYQAA